ncbi:hypothetical protein HS088_TW17G00865 [Tripterygium wilfordii]|uniref:peroxidase n=1 Tax=Tripterygium wilfordii TaxID=458696 RepID=A0A7J7CGY1_TRIWF|nr:hypothetical protein HS088_TW17G00865 [Tripterygium wilfordii]
MERSLLVILMLLIFTCFIGISQGQLSVGFYGDSCPQAESTVTSVVREAVSDNPNMAAVLLRLHFHDCFVEANGPTYQVPAGRRDGRVSNVSLAADMPDVSDSIQQLKTKFIDKGLSPKDLVVLSGNNTTHFSF